MSNAAVNAPAIEFTFQYGEIKSVGRRRGGGAIVIFTFQYGEIKSDMEDADGYKARKFTFQYGEIKRGR